MSIHSLLLLLFVLDSRSRVCTPWVVPVRVRAAVANRRLGFTLWVWWQGIEILELPSPENKTVRRARRCAEHDVGAARTSYEFGWLAFLCCVFSPLVVYLGWGGGGWMEMHGEGLRCIIASWPLLSGYLLQWQTELKLKYVDVDVDIDICVVKVTCVGL